MNLFKLAGVVVPAGTPLTDSDRVDTAGRRRPGCNRNARTRLGQASDIGAS